MSHYDLDDINRKLAILAARHGLGATARKAPRDEGKVTFEAFRWHDEEVLNHIATYPESELSRTGAVSVTTQFIEAARLKLSAGKTR